LGEILESQLAAGQLQQALATCQTIEGAFWRARAFTKIASAHSKSGRTEAARSLLQQAQLAASAVDADYSENAHIFREVAEAYARAGWIEEMLKWADQFPSAKAQAYVFLGLAQGLLGDD
jgi:hypothetical protein